MVIFLNFLFVLAIAVSLSMDAFSLSLSIGTLNLPKKTNIALALLVGSFHFLMPTIGLLLGTLFVSKVHLDVHILSGIIFFYIALLMFKDYALGDFDEVFEVGIKGSFLFALGVSLDSFGIGFSSIIPWQNAALSFLVFTMMSAIFTYIGLTLGKSLNKLIGRRAILIGAIIMTVLGLLNILHF